MNNMIFIAILLIITTNVLSQSALEKAVLNELNLYRKANQLQPVIFYNFKFKGV